MRVLLQPMSALFSLKCSVAIFFDEDSIGIGKDHGSRNYFNPCKFQFDSYLTGLLLLSCDQLDLRGHHLSQSTATPTQDFDLHVGSVWLLFVRFLNDT